MYKLIKLTLLISCSTAVFAGWLQVHAQETSSIQNTDDLKKHLLAANTQANGQEIQIEGAIGTLFGETLYFVDTTGRYEILLDAGREIRREVEACELAYDTASSPCQIKGKAEIQIEDDDSDIADGIEVKLILFAVDSFDKQK